MRKQLFTLIMLLMPFGIKILAQNNEYKDTPFAAYVERLQAFGQRIPQEKIFIHMNNTCTSRATPSGSRPIHGRPIPDSPRR